MAGGSPLGPQSVPAAGVRFLNSTKAKQGDKGSVVLPPYPTNTVWKAGELAEVSWTIRTNHGGGYQYRIAPADAELTEAAFRRTPLPFEGLSSLRWGGKRGRQMYFNGTYVAAGTVPEGSTWAMNPLPRTDSAKYPNNMDAFPAVCYDPNAPADGGYGGLCSGWYVCPHFSLI